jgi:uncharacterized Zn finger protein
MARPETSAKARRYLAAGRLTVLKVHREEVLATCRGQADTYRLGYSYGEWTCSCPARSTCSHLLALQLVVRPLRLPR